MQIAVEQRSGVSEVNIINQSFMWMCIGLLVTTISSVAVASGVSILSVVYSNPLVFYGLMLVELGLVFALSAGINKMSFETAVITFLAYSLLNGVTLSSIFLVYTAASVASAFFGAALLFGVMAFYGYTTKQDLTKIGNLAFMVLIGIIITSLINIFLQNDVVNYVLSYIIIIVFVGLTAYDTQKIKMLSETSQSENLGILGALTLYLDLINIFIGLLRIFGVRRKD